LSLRKNSVYLTVGALLRLALSVISIPLMIRLLGLHRYGIWAVLTSLPMLGGLLEIGLAQTVSRHLAEDYARQDRAAAGRDLATSFLLMTVLGLVGSLGLLISASFLSNLFFPGSPYRPDAARALALLAGLLLLYFWQHWASAVQAGLRRYGPQAAIETVISTGATLGMLLIASLVSSLTAMAAWLLLVNAAGLLAHVAVLGRLLPRREAQQFRWSWEAAQRLLRFGSMQWLANLGSSLFGYVDRILVNYLLGPDAAGVYAAVTSAASKINQLSAIPLQVLPTWISAAKALSRDSEIQRIFIRATRLNGLAVFLIAAPLMFWAQPLAVLLVGPVHSAAAFPLLRLLALIYGLYSLAGAGFYAAIGIGFPRINALVGILSGALVIFALALLAPALGLAGAAWANCLYILVLIINWKVRGLINLKAGAYFAHVAPSVIALLACYLISAAFNSSGWTVAFRFSIFITLGAAGAFFVGGQAFWRELVHPRVPLLLRGNSAAVE
jgi:O-antigen/teichoic acid export membrane protein